MVNKNIFENPFEAIIQKANAQGTNIASPTLPVDVSEFTPQETNTPTPAPSQTVKISLINATTGQIRVDEKIRINIALSSAQKKIQSFTITIEYDPLLLKYTAKSFLSENYTVGENILVDESKSTIVITGTAQSDAEVLNDNVAFVEFLTIDKGTTLLEVSNTNLDSEVLDENGNNILQSVSNLTIGIGQLVPATPTPKVSPITNITGTPTRSPNLPDSSLGDLLQYTPIAIGVVIIGLGFWLKRLVSGKDDEY
jgi:hypothetical protein